MKRIFVSMGLVALLAACSSPVKQANNVPVEEKVAPAISTSPPVTAAKPTNSPANSAGTTVNKIAVAPVEPPKKEQSPVAVSPAERLVYFDFDSFVIRTEFESVIEENAKYIRADKNRKVVIEGHADERGGREYNLALGQKRSEAVRKTLVLLGVPDGQLEAVSFGEEKPAVQGTTEAAMEKNRRAEISYR
ncbi:MAG: peptidoglycan-associated lipoprotein Pal [Rhodoferax sp.]|nr:peptidoglycan-associated lipoprotein Pal [Rhodoferax sp.]